MIERIDEIVGLPVIGQTYLVQCVVLLWDCGTRPVLGAAHVDPDYFPHIPRHYHNDLRFASDSLLRDIAGDHTRPIDDLVLLTNAIISVVPSEMACLEPDLRKMDCYRQMPEFPTVFSLTEARAENYHVLKRIEADFADVKIPPGCRRCPHRGLPLNGIPQDLFGNVVCAGHGLRWSMRTGELVRRTGGGE